MFQKAQLNKSNYLIISFIRKSAIFFTCSFASSNSVSIVLLILFRKLSKISILFFPLTAIIKGKPNLFL